MADDPQQQPARPLTGYRDIGGNIIRHTRGAHIRAWVILGIMVMLYLALMLPVYFLEPGLR